MDKDGWKPSKESCICRKHFFEPHHYKTGAEEKRLRFAKKLMPTIFDLEESNLSVEFKHLKLPVSVPVKSPTKRVYQQDQFKLFEKPDKIKSFDDINST